MVHVLADELEAARSALHAATEQPDCAGDSCHAGPHA